MTRPKTDPMAFRHHARLQPHSYQRKPMHDAHRNHIYGPIEPMREPAGGLVGFILLLAFAAGCIALMLP